jgi:hypothetical protein
MPLPHQVMTDSPSFSASTTRSARRIPQSGACPAIAVTWIALAALLLIAPGCSGSGAGTTATPTAQKGADVTPSIGRSGADVQGATVPTSIANCIRDWNSPANGSPKRVALAATHGGRVGARVSVSATACRVVIVPSLARPITYVEQSGHFVRTRTVKRSVIPNAVVSPTGFLSWLR